MKVTDYFKEVEDPRCDHGKPHELLDVLILSLSGFLYGAESWIDVADYARTKQEWFETFLDLPAGFLRMTRFIASSVCSILSN